MKTNAKELRLLSSEELRTKLQDARQEEMNLRFQVVTGQLTDSSRLPINRRMIARYETLLRERELASENEGVK
jgi:large subunit ribosomal protein L29